ncbi:DUF2169 family type VI secretion system accessory protein [Ruegeria jejuensis]|uniref:DUF2169 family type VI secretion system accessory protein n=1 Tax=Ruegeria jejuensis TaxID=3233338 RepID=UPI00355B3D2E
MEGALDVVVAVRGLFEHRQDAAVAEKPSDNVFQWQDVYDADPHGSPLLIQTDLVPEKPGTDVTFLGESYRPDDGRTNWRCGLKLGPIDKTLQVTGPRRWEAKQTSVTRRMAWEIGSVDSADSVPVDWRLTAGGPLIGPEGPDATTIDPRNPIGLGRPDADAPDTAEYRAPQILRVDETEPCQPAGLGPLAPFWQDRSQYAGTYDEAWKANRHPLLPRDFDSRFWQCAPPDQIATPHLRGDETYCLRNLHWEVPEAKGVLPGIDLAVLHEDSGIADWHVLALDGVQFDWRSDAMVALTWRVRFPLPKAQTAKLTLQRVRLVPQSEVPEEEVA